MMLSTLCILLCLEYFASASCEYCSVFDSNFVLNKKSNQICLIGSKCEQMCEQIFESSKECPRDSVMCGSYQRDEENGRIIVHNVPEFSLCFWKFASSDINTRFSFETLGSTLIFIGYINSINQKNFMKTYQIKENTKLLIDLEQKNCQIIAYFDSNMNQKFLIDWNPQKSSSDSKSESMMILSICSTLFVTLLMIILFCIYLKKKQNISRVSVESRYNFIPQDSSFASFLDSALPQIFSTQLFQDPCCICFDKYFLSRISPTMYYRVLKCNHCFHSECIDEWIHEKLNESSCPLCLKPIF